MHTTFIRNCPSCGIEIVHKRKDHWKNALKNNRQCGSCAAKKRGGRPIKYTRLVRVCPKCSREVEYKTRQRFYAAKYGNRQCSSCANKGKSNPFYGKTHSAEHLEKLRVGRAREVEGRFHGAFFNQRACDYFTQLNNFMGWDGRHAQNGGEYSVAGYFLDYYEPTENIVIEWDEPHHRKSHYKKRDRIREQNIISKLNCDFYRIDEKTLTMKRVSK